MFRKDKYLFFLFLFFITFQIFAEDCASMSKDNRPTINGMLANSESIEEAQERIKKEHMSLSECYKKEKIEKLKTAKSKSQINTSEKIYCKKKGPNESNDEGICVNNELNGIGKRVFSSGNVYEGNFSNNLQNGFGKLTFKDGSFFQGIFIDGLGDGKGTLKMLDGREAVGDFKKGKFVKGTFKDKDGLVYIGEFEDFKLIGTGSVTYPNGTIINSFFNEQGANGRYTEKLPNGDIYQGKFINSKRDGTVFYTLSDGENGEIEFIENVPKSRKIIKSAFNNAKSSNITTSDSRQKGIDSMNCEIYSRNMTSGQEIKSIPNPSVSLAFLDSMLQGLAISNNRRSWYESCMKNLGW